MGAFLETTFLPYNGGHLRESLFNLTCLKIVYVSYITGTVDSVLIREDTGSMVYW